MPADWHTKTRGTPADWHTKLRHASGLAHQTAACQRTGTPNCGMPADWHTMSATILAQCDNICDLLCDNICDNICDLLCDNICDLLCDNICDQNKGVNKWNEPSFFGKMLRDVSVEFKSRAPHSLPGNICESSRGTVKCRASPKSEVALGSPLQAVSWHHKLDLAMLRHPVRLSRMESPRDVQAAQHRAPARQLAT